MGTFLSGLGSFVNAVGPTTADLLKAFNPTTINYAPAAQTPAPTPVPVSSQNNSSAIGELLVVLVVMGAAVLIWREFEKQRRK